MSDPDEASDLGKNHEPKIWRCGEPYRYDVPKPKGDPRDIVLSAFLQKDKIQCETWKDEVQNLLIFAGLFSAVVAGFVVESSRDLKPDPNDAAVILLLRIADRLEGSVNNTNIFAPGALYAPSLTPNSSAIRTNIFWFFSLILSITTSIIGIIALQWIREHQHYPARLTPDQALGIFHLRKEALKRWHIPAIFTSLPLLLQAALVIFLVGLIDFLHSRNPTVAIPVTILISFTFLFLILTTVLPTFYDGLVFSKFSNRRLGNDLPAPCPYQSFAFGGLTKKVKFAYQVVYSGIMSLPSIVLARFGLVSSKANPIRGEAPIAGDWIDFDINWLSLRNKWSESLAEQTWIGRGQLYDSGQALVVACSEHAGNSGVLHAAYHNFQNTNNSPFRQSTRFYESQSSDHAYGWDLSVISPESTDPALMIDARAFIFLDSQGINETQVLARHKLELILRLLAYLFAGRPCRAMPHGRRQLLSTTFFADCLKCLENQLVEAVPEDITDELRDQILMIAYSFFQATSVNDNDQLAGNYHNHETLSLFLRCVATATWIQASYKFDAESGRFSPSASLDLIGSIFKDDLKVKESHNLDYFLYASEIYITYLSTSTWKLRSSNILSKTVESVSMGLRRHAPGVDRAKIIQFSGDMSKVDNWPLRYGLSDKVNEEPSAQIVDFSESTSTDGNSSSEGSTTLGKGVADSCVLSTGADPRAQGDEVEIVVETGEV